MPNFSCKDCSKRTCPFAFTLYSERVQNYGCLPTPHEIIDMRVNHGKTWACHSNPRKPCLGAILHLKSRGLPYKVIDRVLVTDHDQWDLYLSENNFKHGNGVLSINETISDQIIAHLVRLALSASMNTSFKVIRVSPSLD
jgi:hypothetical protein